MAVDIMVKIINGEIESHITHSRAKHALEQLTFPNNMEVTCIGKSAQVVQLLHHHLLHNKLIDDLLFHLTFGCQLLHVKMNIKLLLFLQMIDSAFGCYRQQLVRCIHINIFESERTVSTTEHHTQLQRHLEVLQNWRKGTRDITQLRPSLDFRSLEREFPSFLLAGQYDSGTIELQHRTLLLDSNILDMGHSLADTSSQAQIFHIETRHTVSGHKLRQLEVNGISLQIKNIQQ